MDLSIVIPVLNEVNQIKSLLATLGRQLEVDFELIISDGGSTDGTVALVHDICRQYQHPLKLVEGTAGRGAQLNRGAEAASGHVLLFLHADSRFEDAHALHRSLDALRIEQQMWPGRLVAGHFPLRFTDASAQLLRAMRYWEIKARLHRFGCNHGDQGLMIVHSDFVRLGGYPDLSLFEDTLMAERVKTEGRLILLPAELTTSVRRFAVEGLRQRHTLNAILMACHQVGLDEFFRRSRGHYRQQQDADRLALTPFWEELYRTLNTLPQQEKRRTWRQAAAFVRTQAWQLLLAWRVKQGRWDLKTDTGEIEAALDRFERGYNRLTDNRVGHFLALVLLRFWLAWQKRLWRRLDRIAASH